jgi:hypothetical protein
MRIRQSVSNLTTLQKSLFILGCQKMRSTPAAPSYLGETNVYDYFVKLHALGMEHKIHGSPKFLPFHRQMILVFEAVMGNMLDAPNYALPYWDWAADTATSPDWRQYPIFASDFMGPEGNPVKVGPFSGWNAGDLSLIRNFGTDNLKLPSLDDVAQTLAVGPYDGEPWDTTVPRAASFRNTVEGWSWPDELGMHNLVHTWVGGSSKRPGTMTDPMTAPYDPIFFLHHANIDRLWLQWQRQNYDAILYGYSGTDQQLNSTTPMWPWDTTDQPVRPVDVWNAANLGYSYEGITPAPPDMLWIKNVRNDNWDVSNRCIVAGDTYNGQVYHQVPNGRTNAIWVMLPQASGGFHIMDMNHKKCLVAGDSYDGHVYHDDPKDRPNALWDMLTTEAGISFRDRKHGKFISRGDNEDGNIYHQDDSGRHPISWRLEWPDSMPKTLGIPRPVEVGSTSQ